MSAPRWRLAAMACVAATVGMEALGIVLASFAGLLSSGDEQLTLVVALPTYVLLALVGALILSRLPAHPIGILFALAAVLMTFGTVFSPYHEAIRELSFPGRALLATIGSPAWTLGLFGLAALLPLLFPTGEYRSPRWRLVGRTAAVCLIVATLASILTPGSLPGAEEISNPIGVPGTRLVMEVVGGTASLLVAGIILLGILSLVPRFLNARGDERQQLKWFAAASLVSVGFFFFGDWILQAARIPTSDAFYLLAIALVPASVAVAILRYHLYEIDVVIRRTLVYGLLTTVLGLVYLGLVVGLQALFQSLTGGSDVAIALTTLVVAALFLPVRRRIQDAVDSRFNRRRYDAARTLESFSSRLRDEVDLETLQGDLIAVVNATVQPAHVSLWLRRSEARR